MILTNGGPGGATDIIGLYMFNSFDRAAHSFIWICICNWDVPVRYIVGLRLAIDKFVKETIQFKGHKFTIEKTTISSVFVEYYFFMGIGIIFPIIWIIFDL